MNDLTVNQTSVVPRFLPGLGASVVSAATILVLPRRVDHDAVGVDRKTITHQFGLHGNGRQKYPMD